MNAKVELAYKKDHGWHAPGSPTKSVRYALPFFKCLAGIYYHRVRAANQHWRDGKYSHTSVEFWCGNMARLSIGRLFANVPSDGVLCATCEGRAIGAGMVGARLINGRHVLYSPRRK